MGTRADFYVGIGENARWIGSVAYDGYADGNPSELSKLKNPTAISFIKAVRKIRRELPKKYPDTWCDPSEGWPWPWETSETTDYSYWYWRRQIYVSSYGKGLCPIGEYIKLSNAQSLEFPTFKKGSSLKGLLFVGAK